MNCWGFWLSIERSEDIVILYIDTLVLDLSCELFAKFLSTQFIAILKPNSEALEVYIYNFILLFLFCFFVSFLAGSFIFICFIIQVSLLRHFLC